MNISLLSLLESVAFATVILTLWPIPGWPFPLAAGLSLWGAALVVRVIEEGVTA